MVSKEDIKFEIDQLRKDKMIYAIESIATTVAVFVYMMIASFLFPESDPKYTFLVGGIVSLGYWLFTVYGNTRRFIRIKKLEEKLK